MKCVLLTIAIFTVGALAAPLSNQVPVYLDPGSISHGRPGCQTAEELRVRIYRHNWDPSKWWECNQLNNPAEMRTCPEGELFWDETRTCVPKQRWLWSEPQNPPSMAQWSGVPPPGGICPADNPSCPPCTTPCPPCITTTPCPPCTTTTTCPPCPTTTPCPPCTTTTTCPPCPTTTPCPPCTTTTPCPPCPTTTTCPPCPTTTTCPPCPTTTTCPPCPTTTTCPPCPTTTTCPPCEITTCPPCPLEVCLQEHMGLQWPGNQPNTFIVCHTIGLPGIEMACPVGTIFQFELQSCN